MDPTACVQRFVDAIKRGDRAEARAAADDYNTWFQRGGFAGVFQYVVGTHIGRATVLRLSGRTVETSTFRVTYQWGCAPVQLP